jgi:hypothetical protein
MVKRLEDLFPALRGQPYQITSAASRQYNCIAWAAGDDHIWWWPDEDGMDVWPAGVERVATVEAFRAAFATLGYQPCDDDALEDGIEKVALYATEAGLPRHAARQVANGRWTSKLGFLEDIEHGLSDLAGTEYGTVVLVPKRPARAAEEATP